MRVCVPISSILSLTHAAGIISFQNVCMFFLFLNLKQVLNDVFVLFLLLELIPW